MAVYAIGDVQGCYEPLLRLLDKLHFDPDIDRIWLTGDLVNRGPHSVETLRHISTLGTAATTVLGNHDLTLLAVAEGHVKPGKKDTFYDVLDAPDAAELLAWVRGLPMLHHDAGLGFTMVHGGLSPHWDLAQALACAREVEAVLRGPGYPEFLAHMFGSEPRVWRDDLEGLPRLRHIVNVMTRMRFVFADGSLCYDQKGAPGSQPPDLMPWFEVPWRRNADLRIITGHWAALGYFRAPGIYALDSGCIWGQHLTAFRLDAHDVPCCVDCWEMRKVKNREDQGI